ncbi:hypothetical protein V1519DRAFT_444670 [Lipomyces tetrasporus]
MTVLIAFQCSPIRQSKWLLIVPIFCHVASIIFHEVPNRLVLQIVIVFIQSLLVIVQCICFAI